MRALAVQYAASRYCPPLRQYSEPPGTSRTRDACVFPDNPVSRASAVPASHRCLRLSRVRSPTFEHPAGKLWWCRRSPSAYLSALLTDTQVLIVFQRDVVSEALRLFFRSLGAVALPARTAEQAMDLVKVLTVELVLCDVSLLTADEPGFAARVRERAGHRPLAVLGIGASTEPARMASAHLDGVLRGRSGTGTWRKRFGMSAAGARTGWIGSESVSAAEGNGFARSRNATEEMLKSSDSTPRLPSRKPKSSRSSSAASTSPFRIRDVRRIRPRYRPGLLGA